VTLHGLETLALTTFLANAKVSSIDYASFVDVNWLTLGNLIYFTPISYKSEGTEVNLKKETVVKVTETLARMSPMPSPKLCVYKILVWKWMRLCSGHGVALRHSLNAARYCISITGGAETRRVAKFRRSFTWSAAIGPASACFHSPNEFIGLPQD
jgi:hypothetical protein